MSSFLHESCKLDLSSPPAITRMFVLVGKSVGGEYTRVTVYWADETCRSLWVSVLGSSLKMRLSARSPWKLMVVSWPQSVSHNSAWYRHEPGLMRALSPAARSLSALPAICRAINALTQAANPTNVHLLDAVAGSLRKTSEKFIWDSIQGRDRMSATWSNVVALSLRKPTIRIICGHTLEKGLLSALYRAVVSVSPNTRLYVNMKWSTVPVPFSALTVRVASVRPALTCATCDGSTRGRCQRRCRR